MQNKPNDFDHRLVARVEGPSRTVTTSYGERSERDTLAILEIEVSDIIAWHIFTMALREATAP